MNNFTSDKYDFKAKLYPLQSVVNITPPPANGPWILHSSMPFADDGNLYVQVIWAREKNDRAQA